MEYLPFCINRQILDNRIYWLNFIRLMHKYADTVCIKTYREQELPEILLRNEVPLKANKISIEDITDGASSFARFNKRSILIVKMFTFNKRIKEFLNDYSNLAVFEREYKDLSFLKNGDVLFRSITHQKMYDFSFHALDIPIDEQLKILDEYGLGKIIEEPIQICRPYMSTAKKGER